MLHDVFGLGFAGFTPEAVKERALVAPFVEGSKEREIGVFG